MKPIDLFVLYKFIRKLSTPFEQWSMYKSGVIDSDGNFLQPKDERTKEQLESYSYLDVLILNLKKIIAKVPGGNTRIATFAAALFLLREGKPLSESAIHRKMKIFENEFNNLLEESRVLIENEGGVPANNMGSGQVAQKDNPMNIGKTLKRKHKLNKKECKCDEKI